jgi:NAD(P)-dependent dehydrogenase (short-subunit alcohol dehydrogenase family)
MLAELWDSLPARYPELAGKTAIVTGGARNIGLGIAARLAKEGMRVVVGGLDSAEVEAAVAKLTELGANVRGISGDLSESKAADALLDLAVSAFGGVDVLVNNAADLRRVHHRDASDALLDSEIAVNLRTPIRLALGALKHMVSGGSIINVTSVGGTRAQYPNFPYGMTKGALDAFTRTLAVEVADRGIRVNAIAPGWTPHGAHPRDEERTRFIPMGRGGTFAEIAAAAAFLASPDAGYITGQTIYVDGGLIAQLHPPYVPL